MKTLNKILLLIAVSLAFGAMAAPRAHAQVTVGFFYDSLDPYGEWVQVPDYGYCWHPTGVDDNWAPYTDGYWAYTDGGWTWVSYEDYGGVVYHYGRWTHLPDEGWVWVPGNTWAPAWVSWRVSDDYVGWAPLPPEARWDVRMGFGGWVDARFDIGPGFYSFVGVRDFGAPTLGQVIVDRGQNVTIINNTTNITNITNNNSNVYTGGPSYARIAARTARPIPTLKLVRQGDASAIRAQGGKMLSRQQGNQLMVLAPKITPLAKGEHLAPHKVARTLASAKADHGWGIVKDPQEREKLHAKIKEQSASAGTGPAKPVNPADLKLVDEKIKASPKPVTTGALATPGVKAPKNKEAKEGKIKTPGATDLENAPATVEPGAALPAETPKTGKGKVKKAKPTPESAFTGPGAEETPAPKAKSRKARTPSTFESGEATPAPKHPKGGESNLQPFMSGQPAEPKSRKGSEDSDKSKTYQGYVPSGAQAATPRPKGEKGGKGDKNDKSDKKRKDEGAYPPYGQ
jgi:hypothetical protein